MNPSIQFCNPRPQTACFPPIFSTAIFMLCFRNWIQVSELSRRSHSLRGNSETGDRHGLGWVAKRGVTDPRIYTAPTLRTPHVNLSWVLAECGQQIRTQMQGGATMGTLPMTSPVSPRPGWTFNYALFLFYLASVCTAEQVSPSLHPSLSNTLLEPFLARLVQFFV